LEPVENCDCAILRGRHFGQTVSLDEEARAQLKELQVSLTAEVGALANAVERQARSGD